MKERDEEGMDAYLAATDVVDWHHPDVRALARELAAEQDSDEAVAHRCFLWVRDEIRHSMDYRLSPVPCTASEVLRERSGFCYAKSHLLAALLRANGIPTAFCYQRLSRDDNGEPYCLHGLNAVRLPGQAWYRIDARGNRVDIDARFEPPIEHLAYAATLPGEKDIPGRFAEPLPEVVSALNAYEDAGALHLNLPDRE
ncbi:transglutaminase superfamily protein [Alloalcanivorax xenomutans]|uniref:transglutaminase-like domain-containing protein n=1 Tax=Alloalcanivorax xenomutans TaxID=1094342 RepID=UPI000BD638E9|nr:transglutaminase family protein [Alloalcanivorax xenomutans]SOC25460.1 transglutaminase superfamily protein [Alloalcanivorax xenomutans]